MEVRELEWREYMRVRVILDITKPLVRKKNLTVGGMKQGRLDFRMNDYQTFIFATG